MRQFIWLSLINIFCISTSITMIQADPSFLPLKEYKAASSSFKKQGPIILFTNARDEKHMKEWAAHHLLIGFDLVYIFDHKSIVPLKDEFEGFDERVIVEHCDWDGAIKMPLMLRASQIAKKKNASWILYLDADEFVVLNHFDNVKDLLKAYPHADSLGINWLMFGSNYHVTEPEGLILDNYTRSQLTLNEHVKCFVKPSEIIDAINPHFYCIRNPQKMYGLNNQVSGISCISPWPIEYFNAPAYLAHYVFQSEETYTNRKVNLPRDDNGEFRNLIPNIHDTYNDVQNSDPKEKYSDQIKAFLK
jgi:hypothetical protein